MPSYFEMALRGLNDLKVLKTFKNPTVTPVLLNINPKLIIETLKSLEML